MTEHARSPGQLTGRIPQQQVALVNLLDRLLAGGVVIAGEVTLSIADVDLVRISLRALVMSIRAGMPGPAGSGSWQAKAGVQ